MKPSEVYERAAKNIEQRGFKYIGCCLAINLATDSFADDRAAHNYLCETYGKSSEDYWWPLDSDHHDIRILALCFVAAIARNEGK